MAETSKQPRESFSLKTDDIPGATSHLKAYQYTNKPSYINSNLGIEKSSSQSISFITHRQVNPLNPDYKLPSSLPKNYTPPKFIRDTLDVHDIQGPSAKNLNKTQIRNSLDISDIVTKKKSILKISKPKEEHFNIKNKGFLTCRNTNPLAPEYVICGEDNKPMVYGKIPGSTPRVYFDNKATPHNRNLDVSDIQKGSGHKTSASLTFDLIGVKNKDSQVTNSQLRNKDSVFELANGSSSPKSTTTTGNTPKNANLKISKDPAKISNENVKNQNPNNQNVKNPKLKKSLISLENEGFNKNKGIGKTISHKSLILQKMPSIKAKASLTKSLIGTLKTKK